MKTTKRILSATIIAAVLGIAGQAMGQTQLSGPNGLATSPKLRKQMTEPGGWAATQAPVTVAFYPAPGQTIGVAPGTGTVVIYKNRNVSGVVASPRLQEQLNERPTQILIVPAPLK
jgi:hypothetical protein